MRLVASLCGVYEIYEYSSSSTIRRISQLLTKLNWRTLVYNSLECESDKLTQKYWLIRCFYLLRIKLVETFYVDIVDIYMASEHGTWRNWIGNVFPSPEPVVPFGRRSLGTRKRWLWRHQLSLSVISSCWSWSLIKTVRLHSTYF